jgi:hypothetical protein
MQLAHGQRWFFVEVGLFLVVSSYDEKTGEVVLRPEDSIQLWASKEKFGKDQNCPMQYVTERMAKGSDGRCQEGDLLCNASWDVWKRLRPSP